MTERASIIHAAVIPQGADDGAIVICTLPSIEERTSSFAIWDTFLSSRKIRDSSSVYIKMAGIRFIADSSA